MKILFITSDFLYGVGGIYQHLENLTLYTAITNEVVIIYLNKTGRSECAKDEFNRKIYFIPSGGTQFQRFIYLPLKKIDEIIIKEKPDIIHVHTLFEAFKIGKYPGVPMIFTNHSSSYLKMYDNYFLRKFVLPAVLKKFTLIISPSTELFEKTLRTNALMIPNGVNTERFNAIKRNSVDKQKILNQFGIDTRDQVLTLLSTRRLADKNGVLDFIKANVEYFRNNIDKIRYIVAGSGEQFEEIKKVKEEKGLNNLFLLGELPNNELDNLYYISEICVIPSKMEAISISALEAMACGTVVLANKVGGLAELIEDGVTGMFLIDLSLEKTLPDLLKDNNIEKIKLNAHELVKNKYSWEKISREIIEVYAKLANK